MTIHVLCSVPEEGVLSSQDFHEAQPAELKTEPAAKTAGAAPGAPVRHNGTQEANGRIFGSQLSRLIGSTLRL